MGAAGRYVGYQATWSHTEGPYKWLEKRLADGEFPEGTKVVTYAETRTRTSEVQWVGLQFPSTRAAADWLAKERLVWDEVEAEEATDSEWGDTYSRFTTLRELEAHLDDVSMGHYLGLR